MKRREALAMTATILGSGIVGSQVFLSGCKPADQADWSFTNLDIAFLNEVGETILPESEQSPGAKAAEIGEFMKTMIQDCYSKEEAATFSKGISIIEKAARATFSKGFMQLNANEREELLIPIDQEARNQKTGTHFFTMMKELTLWGYFSSEVGCTQALRYNPIPGRFDGCIPYNEEPAWA